jgi:hypothetical protein
LDYLIDTTTEKLNSIGGMALVGKILEKIGFCNQTQKPNPRYPHILKAIIGLFTQGRTRFEEIDLVREDSFFRESLDLDYVPAKETTRLYLEKMIPEQSLIDAEIERSTITLLQSVTLTPLQINGRTYMPVDIDTSPLDNSKSHKEGVIGMMSPGLKGS